MFFTFWNCILMRKVFESKQLIFEMFLLLQYYGFHTDSSRQWGCLKCIITKDGMLAIKEDKITSLFLCILLKGSVEVKFVKRPKLGF